MTDECPYRTIGVCGSAGDRIRHTKGSTTGSARTLLVLDNATAAASCVAARVCDEGGGGCCDMGVLEEDAAGESESEAALGRGGGWVGWGVDDDVVVVVEVEDVVEDEDVDESTATLFMWGECPEWVGVGVRQVRPGA